MATVSECAPQQIVDDLLAPSAAADDTRSRVLRLQARHQLFPQVFLFVQRYTATRVNFNKVDPRELGLEKYVRLVVERLRDAIVPDTSAGEPPLLPILNRYRPYGSTRGVDFPTTPPVCSAEKSHINLVVQHSTWEADAVKILEASPAVKFHARNDHLGLAIPYEYLGVDHDYEPDFLVRLANAVTLLLEIKGYEVHNPEQINSKHNAARRWVLAVNNLGDFGNWGFVVCREIEELPALLTNLARPATVLTEPQLDILKAMSYVVAFLRTWNRRARRDILEAGLVLMVDDRLRDAFLAGVPVPNRKPGRTQPSLLQWFSLALEQLADRKRIAQELHEGLPFLKLCPEAADFTGDQLCHHKAEAAIRVINQLGEQQARQAVEECVDETANLVPT